VRVRVGRLFDLATATNSILGWERDPPTIERWNDPTDQPHAPRK
jgi:hypothetical protein